MKKTSIAASIALALGISTPLYAEESANANVNDNEGTGSAATTDSTAVSVNLDDSPVLPIANKDNVTSYDKGQSANDDIANADDSSMAESDFNKIFTDSQTAGDDLVNAKGAAAEDGDAATHGGMADADDNEISSATKGSLASTDNEDTNIATEHGLSDSDDNEISNASKGSIAATDNEDTNNAQDHGLADSDDNNFAKDHGLADSDDNNFADDHGMADSDDNNFAKDNAMADSDDNEIAKAVHESVAATDNEDSSIAGGDINNGLQLEVEEIAVTATVLNSSVSGTSIATGGGLWPATLNENNGNHNGLPGSIYIETGKNIISGFGGTTGVNVAAQNTGIDSSIQQGVTVKPETTF